VLATTDLLFLLLLNHQCGVWKGFHLPFECIWCVCMRFVGFNAFRWTLYRKTTIQMPQKSDSIKKL